MATNRRGVSAKQAQRTSRRVNDQTIGTHVSRGSHSKGPANARSVSFSNTRASNRAARGEVHTVMPNTTSGEDRAAYRQRIQQRRQIEKMQRRANVTHVLKIVVLVVALVGVAVIAGVLAFRTLVGSEMSLKDSDAASALVAPKSGEPYYTLVSCELGATAKPLEHSGPDVLLLVRVDEEQQTLSIINIPPSLQVTVENTNMRIADTASSGDAALITALSKYAKVDIAHFVKTDEQGLVGLVDAIGGVSVNVDQVIDDPHAGDIYIEPGTQTLNGESALVFLRADNIKMGYEDQMKHQNDFAVDLLETLFSTGTGTFGSRLEAIAPYLQTDLSFGDISKVQEWMGNKQASDVVRISLPGYLTSVAGVVDLGDAVYVGSQSDLGEIIETLDKGEVPDVVTAQDMEAANPKTFTVEVQNGTEMEGAAGITGTLLTNAGFKVEKVGNAEQQVYDETLVVYKDDDKGPSQAKAVIEAMGVGRAVEASSFYKFDTDVLVIIGGDYKPVN